MSKRVKSRAQELRKREPSKAYEQGFGQNGGVSSLGTTYEDLDSDGVLDTIVKNSPRIGAFKREVGVVNRSYLPQPAPAGPPADNPPTSTAIPDMTATGTVTLSNHFTDADGDPITYVVSSSDPVVATVSETAGTLTVTEGTAYGTATITVTATANGKSVAETFDFIYSFASTQSMFFDGTNSHVTKNSLDTTITLHGFSIWFKPGLPYVYGIPGSNIMRCLCGWGGSDFTITLGGSYFGPATNNLITVANVNYLWSYTSTAPLDTTKWYHLAIRWEPVNSSTSPGNPGYDIFLDGIKVGDAYAAYPGYVTPAPIVADRFTIGGRNRNGTIQEFYNGFVDEAALFGATISEADIAAMRNGNKPADLAPLNPALWWRAGEGAAWDGTNWTIPDETAVFPALGNQGVTTNMAQADVVVDVP